MPVTVKSSPMMEGTSLLGPELFGWAKGRSAKGELSLPGRSLILFIGLFIGSLSVSRSGFLVNMVAPPAQTQHCGAEGSPVSRSDVRTKESQQSVLRSLPSQKK
ncbi:MAG: hypothetical protein WBD84_08380, partial [Methyloceanibacter sp.]